MNILYYANMTIEESDGPSNHVLAICRELARRGHKTTLFARASAKLEKAENFKIATLPRFFLRIGNAAIREGCRRTFANLLFISEDFDVIYERQNRFDLLPQYLAKRWNLPRVVEVNGWSTIEGVAKKSLFQLRGAKAIVVTAPGLKEYLAKKSILKNVKIVYIANGVDTQHFRPGNRTDSERFVLSYVGFAHRHHDIPTVLKAVVQLVSMKIPVELRLIGQSILQCGIEKKVQELGIDNHVVFRGKVPHFQIPEELWEADVCLAIYSRECHERIQSIEAALKLWEYWAACRPAVVTDLPSSQSYIHHLEQRVVAVPPENPQALADAIVRLYSNPKLARYIGENGFKYVLKGHSWGSVAVRIENVLLDSMRQ